MNVNSDKDSVVDLITQANIVTRSVSMRPNCISSDEILPNQHDYNLYWALFVQLVVLNRLRLRQETEKPVLKSASNKLQNSFAFYFNTAKTFRAAVGHSLKNRDESSFIKSADVSLIDSSYTV